MAHSAVKDGESRPAAPRRDRLGFVLRGVGQTLLTAGVIVLLFVVYEVWVTGWSTSRAQTRIHQELAQQWEQGTDVLALPQAQLEQHQGQGIANLYIPRFGVDYSWSILEGVNLDVIDRGPGHYPGTQLPGEKGNFAVAGHRVGKGNPFLNLDTLVPGDSIVVETASTWFVYCVMGTTDAAAPCTPMANGNTIESVKDANGVPGREVVWPSQGQVVDPIPNKPDAAAPFSQAYLTLTTCTPKFTASHRMILHAILDPAYPNGIPKAKSGQGYSSEIPQQIKDLYSLVGA